MNRTWIIVAVVLVAGNMAYGQVAELSNLGYVVVSPNGPLDGGDYGPATPGTTTSGIQEAFNHAKANMKEVYIVGAATAAGEPVVYHVNSTITIPWGQDWHGDGGNYVMEFSMTSGDCLVIDSMMSCSFRFGIISEPNLQSGSVVHIHPTNVGPDGFVVIETSKFEFAGIIGGGGGAGTVGRGAGLHLSTEVGQVANSEIVVRSIRGCSEGVSIEGANGANNVTFDVHTYRCNTGVYVANANYCRIRAAMESAQVGGGAMGLHFNGGVKNVYTAMYARDFADALEPARKLLLDHQRLLRRVLAWQQAIYTDQTLPLWLRDCLVNNLNLLPENAYWAQPNAPIQWAAPLGAFGLDECPRGCSSMGCVVSNWYGDMPLTYFFPDLERAILRDYMQYMRPDGAIALMFAAGDFTIPCFEWLGPLNASCFVDMVHRLWRRTGDDAILREFYPAVKQSTLYTMNMKPAPEGIISAPWVGRGQEWWEHTPVQGMVSHLGGVRLAQLRLAERLAEKMQDAEFAQQCRAWYQQGSELLEKNLWTGEYYMFFNDQENAKKSLLIMSSQLDGDWSMFLNGVGSGVFAPDRAAKALETIRKTCLVDCGLAGFADPNGKALLLEYGTFPPKSTLSA